MAVRITGADVRDGVDRLVVLGVDWDLAPDDAAGTVGDLLAAHLHTDGLAALVPGTPTNVTSAGRAGSRARRHRADGGARSRAPA